MNKQSCCIALHPKGSHYNEGIGFVLFTQPYYLSNDGRASETSFPTRSSKSLLSEAVFYAAEELAG